MGESAGIVRYWVFHKVETTKHAHHPQECQSECECGCEWVRVGVSECVHVWQRKEGEEACFKVYLFPRYSLDVWKLPHTTCLGLVFFSFRGSGVFSKRILLRKTALPASYIVVFSDESNDWDRYSLDGNCSYIGGGGGRGVCCSHESGIANLSTKL